MRLFVALDIPDAVRDALSTLASRLRSIARTARWVRIEGAHLTLKFIGETPPDRAAKIRQALTGAHAPAPIELRFAGLGFFPNARRTRVLWAGVEAGPELRELAANVQACLEPLSIPRETRDFSPHITLARFESTSGLDALRGAVENLGVPEFGGVSATQFHLYESVLKRGGAEYTRLVSYTIAPEPRS